MRDLSIKSTEVASTYYSVVCTIAAGRIMQGYHPKFCLPLFRLAIFGYSNVGELEEVFRRAWLIPAV